MFKLYVCCVLLQALRDLLCCNIVCEAACCCMLGCIRYRGFCCRVFFSSCVSSWKLCVARWAASDIGALGRSWSPVGPTLPLCALLIALHKCFDAQPDPGDVSPAGVGVQMQEVEEEELSFYLLLIKIEGES